MNHDERMVITNNPAISAIYFALLQCGYDYYSFERSAEHIRAVKRFQQTNTSSQFFSETKQDTCDIYPYWPRAAMLETATFYIRPDMTDFADVEMYQDFIMSAGNISDEERNHSFWEWVALFPSELKKVLLSDSFKNYMNWENPWIQQQNVVHEKNLRLLKSCIDFCIELYPSPVKSVRLVLSPIKCVYSSDYHMVGECFIFSSGAFKIESVIHEFLHHIVHPTVLKYKNKILAYTSQYEGIDPSYYLTGNDDGKLNAFEEFLVRSLAKTFLCNIPPTDLDKYIAACLSNIDSHSTSMPCYCGHDCAKCVTYLATKNNDDTLREQSRRFYQEEFGQDISLEKFNCSGGRSDDVFELCQACPFKKCCMEKNVESCSECPQYPCKTLSDYQAKYVNRCNQLE